MKRLLIRIEVFEELLEGDFLLAVAKRSTAIDPEEAREDLMSLLEMEDEDKPAITIDIDKAVEVMRQLAEINDEEPEDDDPSFLYDWIMPT